MESNENYERVELKKYAKRSPKKINARTITKTVNKKLL